MTTVGIATWIAFTGLLLLCWRMMRLQSVRPVQPGEGCSSVSVLVAARDEAPRVGTLIESLLAQDHPDFELIVIDDRSRDGTGEAAARAAAGDPRVQVLRAESRPEGWQGKLHAIGMGADKARGEWLLVLDADQRLAAPDLLRVLIAEFERRGLPAVSLVGQNVGAGWWNRYWLHPILNNPLIWGVMFLRQWLRPRSAWLIGSMGIRRSVYDGLGGPRAATRCAAGGYDDIGWAHTLGSRGMYSAMVFVPGFEDFTNFESFQDFHRGIARWLAALFNYRKFGWLTAAVIVLFLAGVLWGSGAAVAQLAALRLPDPGLLAVLAIPPTAGLLYCRWQREPLWFAGTFYAVAALGIVSIALGAWARIRNRVIWRGEVMHIVASRPGTDEASPESASSLTRSG